MNQSFFAHETAIIDKGAVIGQGTKIWHFTHVMSDCIIGEALQSGTERSGISRCKTGQQRKGTE